MTAGPGPRRSRVPVRSYKAPSEALRFYADTGTRRLCRLCHRRTTVTADDASMMRHLFAIHPNLFLGGPP